MTMQGNDIVDVVMDDCGWISALGRDPSNNNLSICELDALSYVARTRDATYIRQTDDVESANHPFILPFARLRPRPSCR